MKEMTQVQKQHSWMYSFLLSEELTGLRQTDRQTDSVKETQWKCDSGMQDLWIMESQIETPTNRMKECQNKKCQQNWLLAGFSVTSQISWAHKNGYRFIFGGIITTICFTELCSASLTWCCILLDNKNIWNTFERYWEMLAILSLNSVLFLILIVTVEGFIDCIWKLGQITYLKIQRTVFLYKIQQFHDSELHVSPFFIFANTKSQHLVKVPKQKRFNI